MSHIFYFLPTYTLNVDLEECGGFHWYSRYWSALSIQNDEYLHTQGSLDTSNSS